jgi:hypothetical protein
MIHIPVFSVWTSTLFLEDLEEEFHKEEEDNQDLEFTKELVKKMPKTGSNKNSKD